MRTFTGVEIFTMKLPPTPVPAKETTYMCMTFDLPQNGSFHVIADQPSIDNDYVTHHIVVNGCDEGSGMLSNIVICLYQKTRGTNPMLFIF